MAGRLYGIVAGVIAGSLSAIIIAHIKWLSAYRFSLPDKADFLYLMKIGMPLLGALFAVNLQTSIDRMFVANRFGIQMLGTYQFAIFMVSMGQVVVSILNQWLAPQLLYRHGKGDDPWLGVRKTLYIMAAVFVAFLIAYPVADYVLSFLVITYFPKYIESLPLMRVFYFGAALVSVNLAGNFFNVVNRQAVALKVAIISALSVIAVYFVLGHLQLGIMWYAQVFVFGQLLLMLLNIGAGIFVVKTYQSAQWS